MIPVDHLVRRDTYDSVRDWAKTANPTDRVEGGKRVPARFVHIDQSYEGAHVWLHDNVSDKELAEKLKRTRWVSSPPQHEAVVVQNYASSAFYSAACIATHY